MCGFIWDVRKKIREKTRKMNQIYLMINANSFVALYFVGYEGLM